MRGSCRGEIAGGEKSALFNGVRSELRRGGTTCGETRKSGFLAGTPGGSGDGELISA